MRSFIVVARRGALVAALTSMMGPVAAVAAPCANHGESIALQTRVLQTELMVAALSCNQKEKYNSFVRKFTDELVNQGGSLKKYFTRTRGGRGTHEMNGLVTNLANEASQRAIKYQGNFCSDAVGWFDQVLALTPKDLGAFAATRPTANSHGIDSCQAVAAKPAPVSPKRNATPGS